MTNLQTILYGRFTPPPITRTVKHTILHTGKKPPPRYVAPPSKPNYLLMDADRAFTYIKANPGACCKDIAESLGRHISYTYRIRDMLNEQGRITSVRGKPIKRGGPKTTLFYVKDHAPC